MLWRLRSQRVIIIIIIMTMTTTKTKTKKKKKKLLPPIVGTVDNGAGDVVVHEKEQRQTEA